MRAAFLFAAPALKLFFVDEKERLGAGAFVLDEALSFVSDPGGFDMDSAESGSGGRPLSGYKRPQYNVCQVLIQSCANLAV
jgi:hypothetical protein